MTYPVPPHPTPPRDESAKVFRVERDPLTHRSRLFIPSWEWQCDLPDPLTREPTAAVLRGAPIRVARGEGGRVTLGEGGPQSGPVLAFGCANGWWVTLQGFALRWSRDAEETCTVFAAACGSNREGFPDLWFREADVIEEASPDAVLALIQRVMAREDQS